MDIYEELAMLHLTRQNKIFLIPQYNIDNGWSCPDFVGIDFNRKKLLVVEVTTASFPKTLLNKIHSREKQWFEKLRVDFGKFPNSDIAGWPFIIRVYTRDFCKHRFDEFFGNDFELYTFESIGFSWSENWYLKQEEKEMDD